MCRKVAAVRYDENSSVTAFHFTTIKAFRLNFAERLITLYALR